MNTPFNHPRSAVAGPRLPEGASARESLAYSGDAFGPRPHASHRAVFHRLGLSVSVAIALAGCGRSSPFDPKAFCNKPADDIQYSTVRSHFERGAPGAKLVPQALADGVLTDCEYNDIILAESAEEAREYAGDKRALIGEFAQ